LIIVTIKFNKVVTNAISLTSLNYLFLFFPSIFFNLLWYFSHQELPLSSFHAQVEDNRRAEVRYVSIGACYKWWHLSRLKYLKGVVSSHLTNAATMNDAWFRIQDARWRIKPAYLKNLIQSQPRHPEFISGSNEQEMLKQVQHDWLRRRSYQRNFGNAC